MFHNSDLPIPLCRHVWRLGSWHCRSWCSPLHDHERKAFWEPSTSNSNSQSFVKYVYFESSISNCSNSITRTCLLTFMSAMCPETGRHYVHALWRSICHPLDVCLLDIHRFHIQRVLFSPCPPLGLRILVQGRHLQVTTTVGGPFRS